MPNIADEIPREFAYLLEEKMALFNMTERERMACRQGAIVALNYCVSRLTSLNTAFVNAKPGLLDNTPTVPR